MEYKVKHISTAGIAEAIAKAELYRSLNEPEEAESICRDILTIEPQHQLALRLLGSPLQISSPVVGPIITGRLKRFFGSSRIRTSGSTTLGFCTSDAQKRSSMPGSYLDRWWRFSTRLYTFSQRLRKSVQREMMMPSFAGIVACGCSKTQPMNGANWSRNWFHSMPRTARPDSKPEPNSKNPEQSLQGIEISVHHALLEWNNRVFGDRDRLRTHLSATSSDVAITDVVIVPRSLTRSSVSSGCISSAAA